MFFPFSLSAIKNRLLVLRRIFGGQLLPHAINQDGKDRKENQQNIVSIRMDVTHGTDRIHHVHRRMEEHRRQETTACPVIDPPKENHDEGVDSEADHQIGAYGPPGGGRCHWGCARG